jgi:D-lyxose ketol-isomerase
MPPQDIRRIQNLSSLLLKKAGIAVTEQEIRSMEVADFGLADLDHIGIQVIVYVNNDRYCAKELILLPGQICPEHRHPPLSDRNVGKQETFRCRWGETYLYVDGIPTSHPKARVPEHYLPHFNVWHEIILKPGDQYTLAPDTKHWFQAGSLGAVISEFSSSSNDENDVFTDPAIRRVPAVDEQP